MPHSIKITPHGWSIITLGQILLTTASGRTKNWSSDGAYPVHGSTGIIGYTQNPEYKGRAILVARVGANAGKINLADNDYGVTDNTIILKIRESHHTDFIIHLLNQINLNRLVFGSGQPLLTGTQIKQLKISVPPIEEQRAIASALSDMDALLAKLDQLIAKKRDIKQAAMQELLTGRRRLPGFSDTWKFRVLRDLLTQPATYGIVTAGNFQRTGIPMIRGGDIKNGSIGNEMPFVSEEKNFEYARTITQAGDVLICLVGYPGESAKVPEHLSGSNISRSAGLLRLSPQLDPDYLVCYLNSTAGRKNFLTPSAGSAQLVVNLKDLNLLKARFPEVPEQQAIASIQLDLDAEITTLEARREKTRLIKQGMMQELLSGRVRLI